MMASVSEFFDAPTAAFITSCTKEQLVQIADHYDINIMGKRQKEEIKADILASLLGKGVLKGEVRLDSAGRAPVSLPMVAPDLTFEQQRQLLVLQYEQQVELERIRQVERQGEMAQQVELEKIRQSTEIMKLEIQQSRLQLIRDGKLSLTESGAEDFFSVSRPTGGMDIVSNLRLVPKCNERDPDTFFILFERVVDARKRPDSDKVLMLQCFLTGRAQEAYSTLGSDGELDYATVKSAVLKAY